MKSPFTGKEMKLVVEKRTQQFRKEDFEIYFHCYQCEDTGEQFETQEQSELNYNQVINLFRAKYQIPSTEEIIQIRKKYGVSAKMMSQILGFGVNMYSKYESGEVPSVSNGTSIRMAQNPSALESLLGRCLDLDEDKKAGILKRIQKLKDIRKDEWLSRISTEIPTLNNGFRAFNLEKFQNMIKYFAERLSPFKVKMNKLLFYADFECFRRFGVGMSGVEYQAIKMGPVPHYYQSQFDLAQRNGMIEIDEILYSNGMVGEKFESVGDKFNTDLFSKNELDVLEHILDLFKDTSTHEIIDISHKETAWIECEKERNLIPYSYAFELINS
ncbi:type II TA system antitoxin MqsA family protein [Labilibaculum sp.]|uniref:type II TA system antitoxin MqsA family protein n=1 Tax=Labilibaculum sp. TaxID=2060723 RepID=UPI003569EC28